MEIEEEDYFEDEKYIPLHVIETWSNFHPCEKGYSPTEEEIENVKPVKREAPLFPVNDELNERLRIHSGSIAEIKCDSVVNSTSESFLEKTEHSGDILDGGGQKLKEYVRALGKAEKLEVAHPVVMKGFELPSRSIISVLCPRYNSNFDIASKNALNLVYRSALRVAVEIGCRSVALPVVYKYERGYPPLLAAHIACRTLRRRMEIAKSEGIVIVLVFDANTKRGRALESILPLYFPRNDEELQLQLSGIPKEVGDEVGSVLVEERQISVYEGFAQINGPKTEEGAGEDILGKEEGSMFSKVEYFDGEQLSTEVMLEDMEYEKLRECCAAVDFNDVREAQAVSLEGHDGQGRPIVVIDGARIPKDKEGQNNLFLFCVSEFGDTIFQMSYIIVFQTQNSRKVSLQLLREIVDVSPRFMKKNLYKLVIRPKKTGWVRLVSWYMTPMVSLKFWRKKYFVATGSLAVAQETEEETV